MICVGDVSKETKCWVIILKLIKGWLMKENMRIELHHNIFIHSYNGCIFLDTADLKNKFVLFAKFGDKAADGSTIKLTQGKQNK